MAGSQPRAVMQLRGTALRVEKFDLRAPDGDGVVRQGARVQVLTEDSGGFPAGYVDVYMAEEFWPDELPADFPAKVDWNVSIGIFTRRGERQDGSTWSFPELSVSFESARAGALSSAGATY